MHLDRKKLVCVMLEKDMSINELADKADVSRGTISSIKNGKSCADATAGKIAKALDVPLDSLLVKGKRDHANKSN